MSFGQQLRKMRLSSGLTQAALAGRLNVDPTLISRWECGTRTPDDFWLAKLVKFFAGKPGCLETPMEAQQWVGLLGKRLTKRQLQEAFQGKATPEQIGEACRVEPPPGAPPAPTPAQLHAYLNLVIAAFKHWRHMYIQPKAEELRELSPPPRRGRFPFRDYIYVYEQAGFVTRERLQVGLLEWLLRHNHMALLAVPGCGKSTALEELAGALAREATGALDKGSPSDWPLPVLLPLGSYGKSEGGMIRPEPWPEFLPRGIRDALVRSFLSFGDWREQGLNRDQAEGEYSQKVRDVLEPIAAHLEQLRQEGRLALLLDGLNEMRGGADGPLRSEVEAFVRESLDRGNRVAVACRVADYTRGIAGLNRVELLPFDDERIQQALVAYLGKDNGLALWKELARPENEKLRAMLAIPLYIEVLSAEEVLVWEDGRPRLPANRGVMLARFARVLLEREHGLAIAARRPIMPVPALQNALAEMAYRMREKLASRGSRMELHQVYPFLADALAFSPGYQPDWVLDLAAGAKLIDLDRDAHTLSFWKELLEEYFAARHLLALFAEGYVTECQALWRVPLERERVPGEPRDLGEPPEYPQTEGAWEETTILAAGLAGREETRVSADQFVRAVLDVNPGLAGRCLDEGGAGVSDPLRQKVAQTLLEIMQDRRFSVRVRVPCGVWLGRLGDPRFHGPELFCLPCEPGLGFLQVPAGPFHMGSDPETVAHWNQRAEEAGVGSGLYDDELGHKGPVDIPYAYWIARYPVTNAQFRCFVRDDGYTAVWRHCWTEAGWNWLAGGRWSAGLDQVWERYYKFFRGKGEYTQYESYTQFRDQLLWPFFSRMRKERDGEGYWSESWYNAPNQPVVGLTWYEAVAYANWLTEKLKEAPQVPEWLRTRLREGYRVRLPSEAEWEKAARGGLHIPGDQDKLVPNPWPTRQWPWRELWDPDRCNTAEGEERVGWLSPVGMYADGSSPYGCLDLIGNVWEWSRSLYQPYPYVPDPQAAWEDEGQPGRRVVRGGSWDIDRRSARCAYRNRAHPGFLNITLGVRVVVAPGSRSGS